MRGLVIVSILAGCGANNALGYLQPPPSSNGAVGVGAFHYRLGYALEQEYRRNAEHVAPPVSLVPSDGSELALLKMHGEITIDGPVAHTELRFTFHNAENRQREGRFGLTLPPNAAVTRFAMKIYNEWREARVVAREKGREVYESFLHRNIDPALLEQDMGNQFSARVFPIAAKEDKEIILAYDHQVSAAGGYTLALNGLPKVGELTLVIDNNGERKYVGQRDVVPQDVTLEVPRGSDAVAAGEAFVARVELEDKGGDMPLDRVLYLVDTSASRAGVMVKQTDVLRALLAANPKATVAIAVFDQTTVELYRGPAERSEDAIRQILQHGALGASNLGAALERAATAGMSRVVIIGDGMPTAGTHEAAQLAKLVQGIQRVDAVQVGTMVDRPVLQALVHAGKQRGAIADARTAVRQLSTLIGPPEAIEVEGATARWPATTRHVAPGEPVFVFGLRSGTGPIEVRVGGKVVTVTPRKGHARLRRAVATAELAELIEQKPTPQVTEAIEKLALEHELVSPQTSLIVLENEAQEQAFLGPKPGTGNPALDGYTRNIPTGRTFGAVLGAAAGSQRDMYGISFSGSTSLENQYIVDGVNTTGLNYGEAISITASADGIYGTPNVRADVMSPLALEFAADAIRHNAFAFGSRSYDYEDWTPPKPKYRPPYTGEFHKVMKGIAEHDSYALEDAQRWQLDNPGDVAAIIALGEALEASGAGNLAARAYGSIADLYPNRADLLRAAGERLDRTGARALAIDLYRRALRERPDQIWTARLLAWTLFRANKLEEALDVLSEALTKSRRDAIDRVLMDDASLITANLVARHPEQRYAMKYPIAVGSSLRFVLGWETDVTDVDVIVRDGKGNKGSAKQPLSSGGRAILDMTDGFGPESFVIADPQAFPYKLSVHYAAKGPMGIGLGTVHVIRHDGKGGIEIEDRPFLIQNDDAVVELGSVAR